MSDKPKEIDLTGLSEINEVAGQIIRQYDWNTIGRRVMANQILESLSQVFNDHGLRDHADAVEQLSRTL
jgi:hypothetical protein